MMKAKYEVIVKDGEGKEEVIFESFPTFKEACRKLVKYCNSNGYKASYVAETFSRVVQNGRAQRVEWMTNPEKPKYVVEASKGEGRKKFYIFKKV